MNGAKAALFRCGCLHINHTRMAYFLLFITAMAIILIIEDNENNLYLETFLLQRRGHQILQARSGERGIAMAQKEPPDLILLDIQLPIMDGFAVLQAVREVESLRKIKVVAVTSFAQEGDRETILSAGFNGYIQKPIDPETFADTVDASLS